MPESHEALDAERFAGVDFESVRRQLGAAVHRHCPRSMLDHKEDLVQTALVRLLEIVRKGEGVREINATYVWKTAYCVLMDEIRRAHRKYEVAMGGSEGETAVEATGAGPEKAALLGELGDEVRDCLSRLVAPRRHAVVLYFLGHTPIEAGRKLGWTAKRISNLVHRGLADLRRCLEDKGVEA